MRTEIRPKPASGSIVVTSLGDTSSPLFILAAVLLCFLAGAPAGRGADESVASLPQGVKPVWDFGKAFRKATPTRERVCLNGLWRWQPAREVTDSVPAGQWGYFKVPGSWPGTTDYMQKDSQAVHPHPAWKDVKLGGVTVAWYQRTITIPSEWTGRRIVVQMECLNSYATIFLDGRKAGELRFPGGELDLTAAYRPGAEHVLSVLVVAMPLKGVMLSYTDSASAREVKGSVARRGLCGDVFLVSTPREARLTDAGVSTSVRKWEIAFDAGLQGLAAEIR